jgi:hypothetical protein
MAQSPRTTAKGQRKGKNVDVGVAPTPPSPSIVVTAPSTASGAASVTNNPDTASPM